MFDLARISLAATVFLFFTVHAKADAPSHPILTEQQVRENYVHQEADMGAVPILVARVIALSADRDFFRLHPGRTDLIENLSSSYLDSRTPREILEANRIVVIQALTNELSADEIAVHYAQRVYFGLGCRGVHGAAQAYFERAADDLTLADMTLLAAMILAPNLFQPIRHPQRAFERRNDLLEMIAEEGLVAREDAATAALSDLSVREPLGKCPQR